MPTTVPDMLRAIWTHPANRGRKGQAIAGMVLWQAYKRLIGRPFDLTVYGDMTFRAYRDSSQPGRFIYFGGLPDYQEMSFMRRYLRAGDGFIDGGANEGMFTLLAGKLVGPSGEVHAFEAVSAYVDRLRENIRANRLDWVTVHSEAVGAQPGQMRFVVRGTGSRLQTAEDRSTVTVRVVRLDEALPVRHWAMGKLDIEGAEPLALAGAEKMIDRGEPAVLMLELVDHFLARFGSSVNQIRRWLDDRGYDLSLYEPHANRLVPAPEPLFPVVNALAVARVWRTATEARLASSA